MVAGGGGAQVSSSGPLALQALGARPSDSRCPGQAPCLLWTPLPPLPPSARGLCVGAPLPPLAASGVPLGPAQAFRSNNCLFSLQVLFMRQSPARLPSPGEASCPSCPSSLSPASVLCSEAKFSCPGCGCRCGCRCWCRCLGCRGFGLRCLVLFAMSLLCHREPPDGDI